MCFLIIQLAKIDLQRSIIMNAAWTRPSVIAALWLVSYSSFSNSELITDSNTRSEWFVDGGLSFNFHIGFNIGGCNPYKSCWRHSLVAIRYPVTESLMLTFDAARQGLSHRIPPPRDHHHLPIFTIHPWHYTSSIHYPSFRALWDLTVNTSEVGRDHNIASWCLGSAHHKD